MTETSTANSASVSTNCDSIGSTSGRAFTVTAIVADADSAFDPPLSSVAVTVTVASPADTPVSVTPVPETDTVATPVSSDSAANVCAWPASGSVAVAATARSRPVSTSRPSIASTSGRVLTITANVADADSAFDPPLSSVAVTSIVASPADTPASVSCSPETVAVATPVSSELAATSCASPASASVMATLSVPVDPGDTVRSGIESSKVGRVLTITPNVRSAELSRPSFAVTPIVASPLAPPVIVISLPETATVATAASSELAVTVCSSPEFASDTVTVSVSSPPGVTV